MRKRDPLARLDVLVTGQLIRMSLRRELARTGCSHANVHFLTLHDLARELSQPRAQENKLKPLSDVTRGPLMLRAVELAGPLQYFSELAAREGFRTAAQRTLDELRGAGITAEDLRKAAGKMRPLRLEILHKKLLDLAAIWSALNTLMSEHRYADQITLLELACKSDDIGNTPLIIYGIDELTALEMRFASSLIEKRPASVYLPYRNTPSFAWVKPLFEFFQSAGFSPLTLHSPDPNTPSSRDRIQRGLFDDNFSDENPSPANDSSFLVLSAPTRDREAEEIIRETLYSPLAETCPHRRIGILLRQSDPYVNLLRDEMSNAGIEGYFHKCRTLGETSVGRAFRSLSSLLDEKFRRADVMEFLLSSPVKWPSELGDFSALPPAALWNQFSLLAGVTSGADFWSDGLRRLKNKFLLEQERAEEDEETVAVHAEHIARLEDMQNYAEYLFSRLREVNRFSTWLKKTDALWSLFANLVETDEESAALQDELARAEELDDFGVPPRGENFSSFIHTVLATPAAREGRFQVHEPTVATFREAQGVCFDEIFIPGIVEKEVPRPVYQDPLLSDEDRELLENMIGGRDKPSIPRHKRLRERETFAFHCAINSAKRRIAASYPRRDTAGSRDRLPSVYLLKIIEATTGRFTDYAAFDRFFAEDNAGRRLPAGRLHENKMARAATPFQFHIARLAEALRAHSILPAADMLHDHPFLAHGLIAEKRRFHEREFTQYDGLIERDDLRRRLSSLLGVKPFSPTRMETYATCPFRYFAQHLLELNPVEEPLDVAPITPLARGSLVHKILEHFYRDEDAAGRIPLKAGAEKRLAVAAEREFARFARENVTGPALLWRIEQKKILGYLLDFIAQEIEAPTRFVPKHFEYRFEFAWASDPPLVFRGQMDRVDISDDGYMLVWDYKTGSPKPGMKSGSLLGGRALQLPIYRLAAEAAFGYQAENAAYRYLADKAQGKIIEYTTAHWQKGHDAFAQSIRTIAAGITRGKYYPFPESARTCESCPVKTACGAGRLTYKWESAQDSTEAFRAMREEAV